MDSDWSVELGADDPALEFPWSASDGSQWFVDLLRHPEAIAEIPEALHYPELSNFLRAVNTPSGFWLTAKCDVWLADDLAEAEAIYDAKLKFCSYVDLIARNAGDRFSFEHHEQWVKSLVHALSPGDEMPIACEFIVRRCWYRAAHSEKTIEQISVRGANDGLVPGFYVTLYLFGYGNDVIKARSRWAEALRRVNAVLVALAP